MVCIKAPGSNYWARFCLAKTLGCLCLMTTNGLDYFKIVSWRVCRCRSLPPKSNIWEWVEDEITQNKVL